MHATVCEHSRRHFGLLGPMRRHDHERKAVRAILCGARSPPSPLTYSGNLPLRRWAYAANLRPANSDDAHDAHDHLNVRRLPWCAHDGLRPAIRHVRPADGRRLSRSAWRLPRGLRAFVLALVLALLTLAGRWTSPQPWLLPRAHFPL